MYHDMVKSYQENFSNVHVIIYDDFRDDTENEMKKIYQFLGISDNADIDYVTRHKLDWREKDGNTSFMKNYSMG